MQITLKSLKSIITRAILSNSPKVFFPELHAFTKQILHEKKFFPLFQELRNENTNANKIVETVKIEAMKELKSIEKKLRKYALSCQPVNSGVFKWLDKAQELLAEKKIVIFPLEHALFALLHDEIADHTPFLKMFGKIKRINDCKYISTEDMFPKYCAWINQGFYLTQEQDSSAWYSFHVLRVFHERYDAEDYDKLCNHLAKQKINHLTLKCEHNDIIRYVKFESQVAPKWLLTIEEYRNHMHRIYSHIQCQLPSPQLSTATDGKIIDWNYNATTRKFTGPNKKTVRFSTFKVPEKNKKKRQYYGFPSEILKILTTAKQDSWCFSNLFRIIDSCPENEGTQMYDACREINNRIAAKCDLPEFLIISTDSVHINPKYRM